ncbi:MAG: sigma-70 family RNA polymerase sigma factor [gamma proteobacterium symbiont of Bathyaustriella thionipta]|nr:sigma-70 family RNA polymerase sigma factor [gamma proteobacterium symbiont of Bathyaustriella thionipta]
MNCIVKAWKNHEAELRGYLTRRLDDPRLAEDLLQDTFVKALAQGAGFCSLENPRAWLFRVTRNQLVDHLRRQPQLVDLHTELAAHEPEITTLETLSACLPRALSRLQQEDREAISCCDLEGMRQADYAQQKGMALSAAKSRVQRARKRLKQALKTVCKVQFDEQGNVCCFDCKETPTVDLKK